MSTEEVFAELVNVMARDRVRHAFLLDDEAKGAHCTCGEWSVRGDDARRWLMFDRHVADAALRAALAVESEATCETCGGRGWSFCDHDDCNSDHRVRCPAGCVGGKVKSGMRLILGEGVGFVGPVTTRDGGAPSTATVAFRWVGDVW